MERTTQVIGQSGAFLDALELASRAAALDRPVLVIGERGTGKELVAERGHSFKKEAARLYDKGVIDERVAQELAEA